MTNKVFTIILTGILIQLTSCAPKKAFEGTWRLEIPTPRGERNPVLEINRKKATFDNEPIQYTISNDTLIFSAESQAGRIGKMNLKYRAVLKGEKMDGTYMVDGGPFAGRESIFSAKKKEE